jgi:hypothetical protein
VTIVFEADVTGEAANGFQPLVALRYGGTLNGPVDRRLRSDVRFLPLGGEVGEAVQQAFGIRHFEARGAAQGEIGFDGVPHGSPSGQGWAICFSKLTSALA